VVTGVGERPATVRSVELHLHALAVRSAPPSGDPSAGGDGWVATVAGSGTVEVGPLEVALDLGGWPGRVRWSVANRSDAAVPVRSVEVRLHLTEGAAPVRVWRHGYQSWSESSVATLGVDEDPSRTEGSIRLSRGMHHAAEAVTPAGELRSEAVVLIQAGGAPLQLVGFAAGHGHDGTMRVRPGRDGNDPVLAVEAFLGGAVLAPGEERALHDVVLARGEAPAPLLEDWAAEVGALGGARVGAPYQVGWCSWYHYFHGVTEDDLRSNLVRAADWPFDVFQLDDGYQAAIGDWLETNDRFPTAVDGIAAAVAAEGRVPGIWIAPFLAAPDSRLATDHPGWLARWVDGDKPLVGMWNEGWGGRTWTLDTTHPEVLAHLEATARSLVEAGYRYLKLDFTYAPGLDGTFHDPSRTPAQRVRAGFDAVRRGAGDDVFLLGCGAPLAATVGVVDGQRIGPDVAPWWEPQRDQWRPPGYVGAEPATRNAWRATLARSWMHRRLWVNDPDCLMLRTDATRMEPGAVQAWAYAVAASGGMALVSDDLALLGPDARRLLDEVLEVGRAVDAAAIEGPAPRCPDLLDVPTPTRLDSSAASLAGDPDAGIATLTVTR
jgi:alpha-galactosidase